MEVQLFKKQRKGHIISYSYLTQILYNAQADVSQTDEPLLRYTRLKMLRLSHRKRAMLESRRCLPPARKSRKLLLLS